MAKLRGARARAWGKQDDEAMEAPQTNGNAPAQTPIAATKPEKPVESAAKTPSNTLVGLTHLGVLDNILEYKTYPSINPHTMTGLMRPRTGGSLFVTQCFKGKLLLTFEWDENAFDREVIQEWWNGVVKGVDEFLLA
jgi:hypothetical protein